MVADYLYHIVWYRYMESRETELALGASRLGNALVDVLRLSRPNISPK